MAIKLSVNFKNLVADNAVTGILVDKYDPTIKLCKFVVSIYANQEAKTQSENNFLLRKQFVVYKKDFEKYFSIDELSKKDNNIISQCYKFLKTVDDKKMPDNDIDFTAGVDV